MKLFLIAFAVIAAVAADVSHLPTNEYLPPTQQYQSVEQVQYQTPSNDYLPPVQQHQQVQYQAPVEQYQQVQYQAPIEAEPAHELAQDGYRYKTHRRRVIRRNRRDVSHLPSNEYLPPTQQYEHVEQAQFQTPSNEYLAPVQQYQAPVQQYQQVEYQAPVEAEPAHELAQDGYRYKTHRRRVIRRNRRDVSHLPSNEYLPPTHQHQAVEQVHFQTPSNDYLPPVQQYQVPVEHHQQVQYQAPVEQYQQVQYQAPVEQYQQVQYQAPVEAAPAHELAADGYRYKTHRRRVIRRNRRDVSHLPLNEYLPPTQHHQDVEQVHFQTPSNDYLPPVQQYQAPVEHHQQVQYQAPVEQYQQVQYQAPVEQYQQVQYQTPVEAAPAHELASDGYRYRTNRRRVVVRRNRRDVSHLPNSEYLPPSQEVVAEEAPAAAYNYSPVQEVQHVEQVQQVQYQAPVEAEPAHELAQDGYRYKTHRRVVYRRH